MTLVQLFAVSSCVVFTDVAAGYFRAGVGTGGQPKVTRHANLQTVKRPDAGRILPRDESDSQFRLFRVTLLDAAIRGDLTALASAIDSEVLLPDAKTQTRSEFLRSQRVREGRPWVALRNALRFGASFDQKDGTYSAPHFVHDQRLRLEPGEMLVAGSNVRLRAGPSRSAPVVGLLAFDVVTELLDHSMELDSDTGDTVSSWAHVRTRDGTTGFVSVGLLIAAGGDRFYFRKVAGAWKMVAFGYGD